MVALTAVRDREDKVFSNYFLLTGATKEPTASRLTMREELEETTTVGSFHLHQRQLQLDGF
jgi:hypothetical protein